MAGMPYLVWNHCPRSLVMRASGRSKYFSATLPRAIITCGRTKPISASNHLAAQNTPSSTVGVRLFCGRHLMTLVYRHGRGSHQRFPRLYPAADPTGRPAERHIRPQPRRVLPDNGQRTVNRAVIGCRPNGMLAKEGIGYIQVKPAPVRHSLHKTL